MATVRKKGIVIIPVRYESSRLPGKPLAEIGRKPMIQWVVERTMRASLISRVIVATDDERIQACVRGFGGDVMMTPKGIPSGTDRVASVASDLEVEIIVNVQGDEPFIEPDEVDQVVRILIDDDQAVMGTLVKKITDVEELENPNVVKVVVDEQMHALYFSRGIVPFVRDTSILTAFPMGAGQARKDREIGATPGAGERMPDQGEGDVVRACGRGYGGGSPTGMSYRRRKILSD